MALASSSSIKTSNDALRTSVAPTRYTSSRSQSHEDDKTDIQSVSRHRTCSSPQPSYDAVLPSSSRLVKRKPVPGLPSPSNAPSIGRSVSASVPSSSRLAPNGRAVNSNAAPGPPSRSVSSPAPKSLNAPHAHSPNCAAMVPTHANLSNVNTPNTRSISLPTSASTPQNAPARRPSQPAATPDSPSSSTFMRAPPSHPFDMKNLMSKPAPASPSLSASDSEGGYASASARRRRDLMTHDAATATGPGGRKQSATQIIQTYPHLSLDTGSPIKANLGLDFMKLADYSWESSTGAETDSDWDKNRPLEAVAATLKEPRERRPRVFAKRRSGSLTNAASASIQISSQHPPRSPMASRSASLSATSASASKPPIYPTSHRKTATLTLTPPDRSSSLADRPSSSSSRSKPQNSTSDHPTHPPSQRLALSSSANSRHPRESPLTIHVEHANTLSPSALTTNSSHSPSGFLTPFTASTSSTSPSPHYIASPDASRETSRSRRNNSLYHQHDVVHFAAAAAATSPVPSASYSSSSRSSPAGSSRTLTPAGLVVEAYKSKTKQQEMEEAEQHRWRTEVAVVHDEGADAVTPVQRYQRSGKGVEATAAAGGGGSRQLPSSSSLVSLGGASSESGHLGPSLKRKPGAEGKLRRGGSTKATDGMVVGSSSLIRAELGSSSQSLAQTPGMDETFEDEEENPVTPYYTVVGSSAGKVVAMGSKEDAWEELSFEIHSQTRHHNSFAQSHSQGTSKEKEAKTGKGSGIGRSLTRKVSSRWRGTSADGGRSEKQDKLLNEVGTASMTELRGRPSLQERRSEGRSRKSSDHKEKSGKGKGSAGGRDTDRGLDALNISVDKIYPASNDRLGEMSGGSGINSNSFHTDIELTSGRDDDSPDKIKRTNGSGGGSKIWKLMKRISGGGLRDRYQDAPSEPAPPVPALPKGLLARVNDGYGVPFSPLSTPSTPLSPPISTNKESPNLLTRLRSRPSLSGGTLDVMKSLPATPMIPTTPTRPNIPPTPASAPASSFSGSTSHKRPPTTRSSSPVSSDVASSHFFHRTQSTRSSTSSYGDELPPPLPIPNPAQLQGGSYLIGQNILPPFELRRIQSAKAGESGGQTRAANGINPKLQKPQLHKLRTLQHDDWTIVPSPVVELPSLPLPPPRRSTLAQINVKREEGMQREPEPSKSSSPTIPAFSIANSINTFTTKKSSPITPVNVVDLSLTGDDFGGSRREAFVSQSPSSAGHDSRGPPPPRPSRSSSRPSPTASIAASRTSSPLRGSPGEMFVSRADLQVHKRKSSGGISTTSTARPIRRTSSFLSWSSPSTPISQHNSNQLTALTSTPAGTMTFRELGSGKGAQGLTEQEKADRWEDLLARSARAGGTLHLGAANANLPSDELRFSGVSQTSDV